MFIFCSYDFIDGAENVMHNRVGEVRRLIRTLRLSMLEAEAVMREQINRHEDCSFVAGDILKMRAVMAGLVRERVTLGDIAPIIVDNARRPRRASAGLPAAIRPAKRQLIGTASVAR
jgi:hypothetical protein